MFLLGTMATKLFNVLYRVLPAHSDMTDSKEYR